MNLKVVAIAGSAVSLVVGAAAGYFIAKKQMEKKFDDILNEEIDNAKAFYKTLYKAEDLATPEGALAQRIPGTHMAPQLSTDNIRHMPPPVALLEAVRDGLKYGQPVKTNGSVPPEDSDDDLVQDDPDSNALPYVISIVTYQEDDSPLSKVELTYYEEDDLLLDSNEMPIDNVVEILGENALESFGRKSRDPNVVYVRNVRIATDFEVTRKRGSYAKLMHGITDERRPRVKKMRKDL